ncbi:MAG: class I SAM-dependent methyltransferase [Kiloniellales bacterium]
MDGTALYSDPELIQLYDLDNPWGPDDDFYLSVAREQPGAAVLDLGCGTGRLASRLAELGHRVVGVDPAAAMLDVARKRPGGGAVEWLEGDARNVDLARRFDLILMTGHTFQTLLSANNQRAMLANLVKHLSDGGRFAFESRNPRAQPWRDWTPGTSRRLLQSPQLGRVEVSDDGRHDSESSTVELVTKFRFLDRGQERATRSRLRFTEQATLSRRIAEAGLTTKRLMGDWQGRAYSDNSREIIVVGQRGS